METQNPNAAKSAQSEQDPLYTHVKCTCTMTNLSQSEMNLQSADLSTHAKWEIQPWSIIGSPNTQVVVFQAEGRDSDPNATEGTVYYQFPSAYGGQIVMTIYFNVPATRGESTITVGLSGNVTGAQGKYTCNCSYDSNPGVADPKPNIVLTWVGV